MVPAEPEESSHETLCEMPVQPLSASPALYQVNHVCLLTCMHLTCKGEIPRYWPSGWRAPGSSGWQKATTLDGGMLEGYACKDQVPELVSCIVSVPETERLRQITVSVVLAETVHGGSVPKRSDGGGCGGIYCTAEGRRACILLQSCDDAGYSGAVKKSTKSCAPAAAAYSPGSRVCCRQACCKDQSGDDSPKRPEHVSPPLC